MTVRPASTSDVETNVAPKPAVGVLGVTVNDGLGGTAKAVPADTSRRPTVSSRIRKRPSWGGNKAVLGIAPRRSTHGYNASILRKFAVPAQVFGREGRKVRRLARAPN